MTATMVQPADVARANALAMEIGATFQRERQRRRERILDVAIRLGMSPHSSANIINFEQGAVTGVRLDTILRYLGPYGFTLAVVPLPADPAEPAMPLPKAPRIGRYSLVALELAYHKKLNADLLAGELDDCREPHKVAHTTIARLRARFLVTEGGNLTRLGLAAMRRAHQRLQREADP